MATTNIAVHCSVLLWVGYSVWWKYNHTVLMIPPSPFSLEGKDRGTQMRKVANTVKMASLDTEMMKWERVVCGRKGEGSEVCMEGSCSVDSSWSRGSGWSPFLFVSHNYGDLLAMWELFVSWIAEPFMGIPLINSICRKCIYLCIANGSKSSDLTNFTSVHYAVVTSIGSDKP